MEARRMTHCSLVIPALVPNAIHSSFPRKREPSNTVAKLDSGSALRAVRNDAKSSKDGAPQ
jgi:hypothetical protein